MAPVDTKNIVYSSAKRENEKLPHRVLKGGKQIQEQQQQQFEMKEFHFQKQIIDTKIGSNFLESNRKGNWHSTTYFSDCSIKLYGLQYFLRGTRRKNNFFKSENIVFSNCIFDFRPGHQYVVEHMEWKIDPVRVLHLETTATTTSNDNNSNNNHSANNNNMMLLDAIEVAMIFTSLTPKITGLKLVLNQPQQEQLTNNSNNIHYLTMIAEELSAVLESTTNRSIRRAKLNEMIKKLHYEDNKKICKSA